MPPPYLNRFLSFLPKKRAINTCWEWGGAQHGKGYGHFRIGNKIEKAHRVSWYIFQGAIPIGMQVLHKCDNPPCVNPRHLFLGTDNDNKIDRQSKGRQAFGSKNGRAKLVEKQVVNIRNSKLNAMDLAHKYKISCRTIRKIRQGISWKHI